MVDDSKPWGDRLTDGWFKADTDVEPGDTNIQVAGLDVQPHVFFISIGVIIAFILVTLFYPGELMANAFGKTFASAEGAFGWIQGGIVESFSWLYILAVNLFIIVVLFFALSRFGKIRLGGVGAEKEFSDLSWVAMLFSAGMGIGLMFWSVGEPLFHFADPLLGAEGETAAGAEVGMATTYFHWGFHPWAIYGLVGLGLAFFSFNRGLPLTFRSVFWPILGDRIYGWPGHVIDILTVFATLFGIATSLGLGALQISAGLSFMGNEVVGTAVPTGTGMQVGIIAVITAIALVSVGAGLDKGIRRLSTLNVGLMLAIMVAVLIAGPTVFVLGLFPQALGTYLSNFPQLALWSDSFGNAPYAGWMNNWTIFYWGWWIAWSPFVGLFIARISRGRTVREFIGGVLIIPAIFSFFWMSVLGGTALHFELFTEQGIMGTVFDVGEEVAMFELFTLLPFTILLSALAIVLVTTFFVTSSDSGSLVLGHLSSGGKHDAPRNQRIAWALAEGIVASVLLIGGGLGALQTAAITAGLPFALVLVFLCYSLYLGLSKEYRTLESDEFAEWIEKIEDEQGVVVKKSGSGVVTNIRDTGSGRGGTAEDD
ncbi:BCCT family transporter [Natronorubrum sulfidifaciens]|uniref:Choline/carnitine/betaine transporter n=1 Tax=Natronorubrum sulfidifaciens JCM 14089 TaxID=1230460 RepID=L9WB33_9EURY|nr:BCCT family transporter [Natronorubrum sulfidifaciens]ELY46710.1 choline/carnitine/betaine transporter [Natronorubrum sulfidifaciens JCM 14089]